jgi:O-antigen biosynthesis protein
VATGPEPWLALTGLPLEKLAGRLVEITMRSSLWDLPVRPVLRFHLRDGGTVEHIGAGPIVGATVWIGRVPPDAVRLTISPTNRLGPFDFRVERVRRRWWPALLAAGLRRNPKSTRSAVLTRLIGWGPESDNNLAWAIGATPLSLAASWRCRRERAPDLSAIDRPRFDWTTAPLVTIVVRSDGADAAAIARTCTSLKAQLFTGWRAVLTGTAYRALDPRIATAAAADVGAITSLVGTINAGDVLPPTALAYLVEQAQRHPRARVFYGDVLSSGSGRLRLLPGWSPRLQANLPYLRAPVFLRTERLSAEDRAALATPGALPPALASSLSSNDVLPLRRVMLVSAVEPQVPRSLTVAAPSRRASASIIIPTKDHPALLARAVASVRARTAGAVEIVVVDNASVTPEARRHLESLRGTPGVTVVDYPGAFNFSAICNEAAAIALGEVLVFLNDDTEVLTDDWLDRLCAHATDPTIGAVGARLTYPDGRLQHVGVLLGMGGSAGHFGAPAPGDDAGWMSRNLVVHEVSAVTGACLAVARHKFEAVGGFDAEHLPIELSDIDLCLKLNARGFQTIVDPAVHILHEESASRGGATLRRLTVHGTERAVFLERWQHVLRDDPFFHPGLSLYSWHEALG